MELCISKWHISRAVMGVKLCRSTVEVRLLFPVHLSSHSFKPLNYCICHIASASACECGLGFLFSMWFFERGILYCITHSLLNTVYNTVCWKHLNFATDLAPTESQCYDFLWRIKPVLFLTVYFSKSHDMTVSILVLVQSLCAPGLPWPVCGTQIQAHLGNQCHSSDVVKYYRLQNAWASG